MSIVSSVLSNTVGGVPVQVLGSEAILHVVQANGSGILIAQEVPSGVGTARLCLSVSTSGGVRHGKVGVLHPRLVLANCDVVEVSVLLALGANGLCNGKHLLVAALLGEADDEDDGSESDTDDHRDDEVGLVVVVKD